MNPILSISMLVSRNRDTLEKCLQSLQPFFDELQAELVVVDTGAPKEAIELVKKYTDHIVSFAWCNDFSAARNAPNFAWIRNGLSISVWVNAISYFLQSFNFFSFGMHLAQS